MTKAFGTRVIAKVKQVFDLLSERRINCTKLNFTVDLNPQVLTQNKSFWQMIGH